PTRLSSDLKTFRFFERFADQHVYLRIAVSWFVRFVGLPEEAALEWFPRPLRFLWPHGSVRLRFAPCPTIAFFTPRLRPPSPNCAFRRRNRTTSSPSTAPAPATPSSPSTASAPSGPAPSPTPTAAPPRSASSPPAATPAPTPPSPSPNPCPRAASWTTSCATPPNSAPPPSNRC